MAEIIATSLPTPSSATRSIRHLFRRVISTGELIPELDGLRAVAICAVAMFHAAGFIYVKGVSAGIYDETGKQFQSGVGWIVSHGFLGVQLFFVISGFVVTLPFARAASEGRPRPLLRTYFLRRLTRIEPPYLLALTGYLILTLVKSPGTADPAPYAAGTLYLKNLLLHERPWPFILSWSLEVEIQFYLIAPLLATVFLIRSTLQRRAVLIVAIGLAAWFTARFRLSGVDPAPPFGPLQHGWWLGPELSFFLAGILVADLQTSSRSSARTPLPPILWDLLWICGLIASIYSYAVLAHSAWGISLLVGGLFTMCVGTFRSRLIRSLLRIPVVTMVGGACYTIYLVHTIAIAIVGRAAMRLASGQFETDMLTIALATAAIAVSLSLLAFPFVERPFMFRSWPRRLVQAVQKRSIQPLKGLFAERDDPQFAGR